MAAASLLRPDVLVVGGGIAGSTAAIAFRHIGLDVHLVERAPRFHDRIRGETIHPWGVSEIRRLNLLDLAESGAQAQRQVIWQTIRDREIASAHVWAETFPNSPFGLGFNHVELQQAFLDEAARLGATLHRPADVSYAGSPEAPTATITTSSGDITMAPRLIVAADGEHSATRTRFGGSIQYDPAHHALGGVLVQGLGLDSDRIHQAYMDGGFAFVSPQSNDRARVYIVASTERAQSLQHSPTTGDDMVRLLVDATPEGYTTGRWDVIGPAGFFPNATASVTFPSTSPVVLIGDAAGRNDPSQGHGLSLVFHDVATLADLLKANSDWQGVPSQFHAHRAEVFETLRQHAHWNERQATETGLEIDAIRERIRLSREADPSAAGFAGIFATGPVGLQATEAARRVFLGEDFADTI